MKTSIKIFTLLFALTILTSNVKAQNSSNQAASGGIIFSAGVESGVSAGNFSRAYGWNIGGSIQADIPLANKVYATINAGYLNFNGKNNVSGTNFSAPNIRLLPAMTGLKYFPVNNFYVESNTGVAFALNKSDVGFTKTAAFVYAPQVGYQFLLSAQNYIDIAVRYEGTTKFVTDVKDSKINFFELRVAYAFGGK